MNKLLAAVTLLTVSSLSFAEIQVHHGYLRASAPGAPNSAGFMVLINTGSDNIALTGAKTEVAKVAELHNHVSDNGVMRMRKVAQIELPAGAHVELKPGGLHLMLMGLAAPLQAGETASLTLEFDNGTVKQLELPIARQAPAQQHSADHRHQHHSASGGHHH